MGTPVPISFGTGSNRTRFGLEGIPEFTNAYLENLGDGSKTGFSAYAINGTEAYSTLTSGGAVRRMLDLDDKLLAVAGRSLFAVPFSGSSPLLVGGIGADGFVTMERNRRTDTQAVIVCAGLWWYYSEGVLTEGTDPDLSPPIFVIQKDGYFIFGHANGKWSISGVDDITVSGLDFAEAESNADGLVMGAVRGPDVILWGAKSADLYQNTGAQDFPFTRTMSLNIGCWCAGSVSNIILQAGDNPKRLIDSVIWAATDREGAFAGVYLLDGFTPVKISTDEVDRLIRDEPNKDDIRSFSRSEDGHVFYELSGAAWTRTFDSRTGYWFKVKHSGLERSRYGCHAYFGGKHVFGSYTDNTLWVSRPDLLTEAGQSIDWVIVTPSVHMSPFRFRVNALHVGALTGVGAVSGEDEDTDPKLLLDYSKDGGKTFGAQRECSLGKAAQRGVRIKERAFGMFGKNGVAWRFQCSAAAMKGLQELAIDADKMAA
jgi:hypothetical protein